MLSVVDGRASLSWLAHRKKQIVDGGVWKSMPCVGEGVVGTANAAIKAKET